MTSHAGLLAVCVLVAPSISCSAGVSRPHLELLSGGATTSAVRVDDAFSVPARQDRSALSPSPRASRSMVRRLPPRPAARKAPPVPAPTVRRPRRVLPAALPAVLRRVRSCESGPAGYATGGRAGDYDYTAENAHSTASGAWQVLRGTWGGFRGYRTAGAAPRAVQDEFALRLYAEQGTRPWNASRGCWGR